MINLSIAQLLEFVALAILVIPLLAAAAASYAFWQTIRLPPNAPDRFLEHGRPTPDQRVVVCLGASMVHGRVGVNFVDLVAQKFPVGYSFVNAGIGGDTLFHAWQRLESVVACQPDFVFILCGTNDILGILDSDAWRRYRGAKRLLQPPSLEHYRDTLQEVVRQLKTRTRARVALCSLPVLGEDLASLANQRVCEFNAVIRQTAEQEQVRYLPIFERESRLLTEHQQITGKAGRAFVVDRQRSYMQIMLGAIFQHFLLGRSFDDLSRRNGLLLKTDLIHGNSQEAAVIEEEIETTLKANE
jgi:lysophospholipase L1-like esterase